MDNHPDKIYGGSAIFSALRLFYAGIGFVLIFAMIAMTVLWSKELLAGTLSLRDRILFPAMIPVIVWGMGYRICHFLHAFTIIGVSDDALWFKNWTGWQKIPWAHVHDLDDSLPIGRKAGLFVYSDSLSVCYRSMTEIRFQSVIPLPRRGLRGRALFLSPDLHDFPELKAMVVGSAKWAEIRNQLGREIPVPDSENLV